MISRRTQASPEPGQRPEAAQLVAGVLGRELEWVIVPWDDMIPAVIRGDADAVWCGQGIIPSRQEQVDFTRPYAVFNESVRPCRRPGHLTWTHLGGYKVAAIEGSAKHLAETFPGARLVPFGPTDDARRHDPGGP